MGYDSHEDIAFEVRFIRLAYCRMRAMCESLYMPLF
jgi:hypothetical protein